MHPPVLSWRPRIYPFLSLKTIYHRPSSTFAHLIPKTHVNVILPLIPDFGSGISFPKIRLLSGTLASRRPDVVCPGRGSGLLLMVDGNRTSFATLTGLVIGRLLVLFTYISSDCDVFPNCFDSKCRLFGVLEDEQRSLWKILCVATSCKMIATSQIVVWFRLVYFAFNSHYINAMGYWGRNWTNLYQKPDTPMFCFADGGAQTRDPPVLAFNSPT